MATLLDVTKLQLGTGSALDLVDTLNKDLENLKSNDDKLNNDVATLQEKVDALDGDYVSKGTVSNSKDEDIYGKKTFKGGVVTNTVSSEDGSDINVKDIVTKESSDVLKNKSISGEDNTLTNIPLEAIKNLLSSGKISTKLLPDFLLGQLMYGGLVDETGKVTPSEAFTSKYGSSEVTLSAENYADYSSTYFIVQGKEDTVTDVTIAGVDKCSTGDWLVGLSDKWGKIDNTDAVTSVDGQTGNVTTNAVKYTEQTLTESQKEQVRKNIGLDLGTGSHAWGEKTDYKAVDVEGTECQPGSTGKLADAGHVHTLPIIPVSKGGLGKALEELDGGKVVRANTEGTGFEFETPSTTLGSGEDGAIQDADKSSTDLLTKGAVSTEIDKDRKRLTSIENDVKNLKAATITAKQVTFTDEDWSEDGSYKKIELSNASITKTTLISAVYSNGTNSGITDDYDGKPIVVEAHPEAGKIVIRAHSAFGGYVNYIG